MIGTTVLVVHRLWSRRWLTLCLLFGLAVAVALMTSVPLYAEAVHNRLLAGHLTPGGAQLPPFSFLWRYVGDWNGPLSVAAYQRAQGYLAQGVKDDIGLPLQQEVTHAQTERMQLFPAPGAQQFVNDRPLMWASLGFISGLEEQVRLTEGDFPAEDVGGAIPVLASSALAGRMGLQVGEAYTLFRPNEEEAHVLLYISGIWQPRRAADPFWFYPPDSFEDVFLTDRTAWNTAVDGLGEAPVAHVTWYHVFDGARVRTGDVEGLLQRVRAAEARATSVLSGAGLAVSPVRSLQLYRREAHLLTVLLTIYSVPVLGLVCYFIILIMGQVVQRDQNEIAALRSRGSSRLQIALVYLVEGLLLALVGWGVGLFAGQAIARLMGRTRTFLVLDPALPGLPIVVSPVVLQYGALALLLALLALLAPAVRAARHTIVSYKRQQARALTGPLWQRVFLELLLLAPLLYGWRLLRRQGGLAGPGGAGDDPFSNPLLLLVPSLFCLVVLLLFVRLLPWVMAALAALAARLPGVTGLLLLRQMARAGASYGGPLLLVSLTLSLAVFIAATARTLDDHLVNEVYYEAGADMVLIEPGQGSDAGEGGTVSVDVTTDPEHFSFLPVEEHLRLDGVWAAARVGDYRALSTVGGRQVSGRLLGVDRLSFGRVAHFRPEFAGGEPLGSLMNRLALSVDHLLVSHDFLARNGLSVGDGLRLTVSAGGAQTAVDFTVAGALDLFPTYYPQDGPLFVANLDHVHAAFGGVHPYEVWLETSETVSGADVMAGARSLGFNVSEVQDTREALRAAYTRPERQGLLGLLSAGFVAAAALSLVGYLVYAVAGFRRRYAELGMLRAVGLSAAQMAGYLVGEQTLLVLSAVVAGTAAGVAASRLFIPAFQVAGVVPPFRVQLAWDHAALVYVIYGGALLAAVALLLARLMRMRLFEAIKLGEAV
ncbi:MAG: FtsX-like permease family protein [bacterium]